MNQHRRPVPGRCEARRGRRKSFLQGGFLRRSLSVESLESRSLLAADASLAGGVLPEGEALPPYMSYNLQVVHAGTNTAVTTPIQKGTDVDLVVTVRDLRGTLEGGLDNNRGVFAGFLDVLYNKSLAAVELEEVQLIHINGDPTGGSFTLTFTNDGVTRTTAAITYDPNDWVGTATRIQNALAALSNIGAGNVEVVPLDNTLPVPQVSNIDFRVRFQGRLGDKDVSMLSGNATGLIAPGTKSIVVTEVSKASAANFKEAIRPYTIVSGQLQRLYINAREAINGTDRIDEVGGVLDGVNVPGVKTDPKHLFRVRLNTLDAGMLDINGSVSSMVLPAHQTLVLGQAIQRGLLPSEISIINPADVKIIEPFSAITDVFNTTEDAALTTLDVRANDRANDASGNPIGPLPSGVTILSVSAGSLGGTITINTGGTSLSYKPAANASGVETFTYTLRNSTTGVTDTATVTVNIAAVNDAPVNTVPAGQVINEDVALVFSGARTISVADVDAGTSNMQVVLTVNSGAVTLSGTTGLTFVSGNGTGSVTLQGPRTSINAALLGMSYQPDADFSGSDSLQIVTSDLGNTGSGGTKTDTDSVGITVSAVNDAPVVTVPGTQQATEFIPLDLPAVTVTDVDLTGPNAQIVLSVDGDGALTLATTSGLSNLIGNGTNQVSFQGSLADVNAALNGVEYVPSVGDAGTRTITVRAEDNGFSGSGGEKSDEKSITVNVTPLERPFARNDAFTVQEDSTSANAANLLAVLANDLVDGGNSPLLLDFTQPAHGTVTRDENGTPSDLTDDKLIYVPAADFFGTDTFTYRLNQTPNGKPENELDDDQTATVTLTVVNTPDAAVADDDSATTNEDTFVDIAVMADDIDVDLGVPPASQTPTVATHGVVIVSGPAHGTAVVNPNGTVRYTPTSNYSGSDSFTYKLNDGVLDSNVATVNITIDAVNDAPVAGNDSYNTNENTQLNIGAAGVLSNDSDVDGPSISVSSVTQQPTKGSLTLNSDGSFTYTPNAGVSGTDTFKYRATDGSLLSNVATVTITINANPTALDDSFTSIADIADQTHNVLANDSVAPDVGETLTIIAAGSSQGAGKSEQLGTVTIAADGKSILYTPALGYEGTDTYTYTISDGKGGTDTATVTVNVIAYVPTDITGIVYIDSDNDNVIDPNERRLAGVEIILQRTDVSEQPVVVLTDVNGQYLFDNVMPGSYTIREAQPEKLKDGKDRYNTSALGSDNLPIIKTTGNDFFTIVLPTFGTLDPSHTLSGNNFGEPGFVTGFINSTALRAYTSANNLWVHTTTANSQLWQSRQLGWQNLQSASFNWTTKTLTVVDDAGNVFSRQLTTSGTPRYRQIGGGTTANKLVRIEASAANFGWTLMPFGSPRAVEDNYGGVDEDQVLSVLDPAEGVLGNDVDPDSSNLSAILFTGPSHGSLTLNSDGTFIYTPDQDYNGLDSFTYKASDGVLTSLPATVTIVVHPINDDPTAVDDSFLAVKDTPSQSQNVLGNDSIAPDSGETLTIVSAGFDDGGGFVSGATENDGTVAIAPDGKSIQYTPFPGFLGFDSYTYTISDGNGGTDTATVDVEVTPYIPTDITGVVYRDSDNDNVIDTAERRFAGVEINLQGTDYEGTPVNITVQTDIDGKYLLPAVKPGGYTVRELQPENVNDGKDRFSTATLGSDSLPIIKTFGNDFFNIVIPTLSTLDPSHTLANNNFGEGGFVTGFINSTAYGAYTSANNLWLNLRTDNTQLWQSRQSGWANLKSASFDWVTKTLTVEDLAGNVYSRQLTTSGTPRYRVISNTTTTTRLVRIEGTAANFGWTLLAPGEGEGEAPDLRSSSVGGEWDDYEGNVDRVMRGL